MSVVHITQFLVFENGVRIPVPSIEEGVRLWNLARRPSGVVIVRGVSLIDRGPLQVVWRADQVDYQTQLAWLRARLERYASVALEHAQNLADYGRADIPGARMQYPVTHPMFPD